MFIQICDSFKRLFATKKQKAALQKTIQQVSYLTEVCHNFEELKQQKDRNRRQWMFDVFISVCVSRIA